MVCDLTHSSVTAGFRDREADFDRNFAGFSGGRIMADDASATPPGGLNPNALSVANAARLLTKAGGERVTEEMIQDDLAAGAPANADGTINLVHYAAWLVKEMSGGD
jgi:hypothetical protein